MERINIVKRIGEDFVTSNIEGGEFSYVKAAGSKTALESLLPGIKVSHFKVDIRFVDEEYAILVETKQKFVETDKEQLKEYVLEEKAMFPNHKIIAILANTEGNKIKVWKDAVDAEHELNKETVLDTMEHYKKLFTYTNKNNREMVQKNAVELNDKLHTKNIGENIRSQFGGTVLLYIQDVLKQKGISEIANETIASLKDYWDSLSAKQICSGIQETMEKCLKNSQNKEIKMRLTYGNVIGTQQVKELSHASWVEILIFMTKNIYAYIDFDSVEGQDILNKFFTTFNKYVGKKDKNQAYTPDHIAEMMCQLLAIDKDSVIVDPTCGSGSFLVQAAARELSLCGVNSTDHERESSEATVRVKNLHGIECEEVAFGLAVTNMLLHGIKDDNIELASAFDCFDELVKLGADAYIMNPPYNAKPINIPEEYKKKWGKSKNAKEDPTKGMVFVQLVSNAVKKRNEDLKKNGMKAETSKLAVLLPVAAARGTSEILRQTKEELLKDNTLEAVMTLPDDIFHPGASVNSCCMVFKLGESHVKPDGTVNKTFFGYFKNDGHKKKKNYGRVELFDENKKSIWKKTEDEWLSLYRNKEVKPGLSAMAKVTADDEWLCEEYMDTDYNNLYSDMWQKEVQNLAAYEIKTKKIENTSKMDVSKWKEFKVGTLFPKRKVKHYSSTPDCEGHIPFITSTSENNGVSAMVDVDEVLSGNAITVSTNGSCFDCFYQENDFAISNDVEVLYGKHLNKYTALFIIPLLKQEKKKYSYGRKAKNNKVFDTIIKLPVVHGEDGNPVKVDGSFLPDWKFMEEYIKKYNCIN